MNVAARMVQRVFAAVFVCCSGSVVHESGMKNALRVGFVPVFSADLFRPILSLTSALI